MNRAVEFEYAGQTYTAYCPAGAVFDIYDKFGVSDNIVDATHLDEPTREGWDACCWMLAAFSRWGELQRRYMGEDPRPMLSASALQFAPASEVPRLRRVVTDALSQGFRQDVETDDEDDEVDLVLQRLEADEKKASPRGALGQFFSRRRRKLLSSRPGTR